MHINNAMFIWRIFIWSYYFLVLGIGAKSRSYHDLFNGREVGDQILRRGHPRNIASISSNGISFSGGKLTINTACCFTPCLLFSCNFPCGVYRRHGLRFGDYGRKFRSRWSRPRTRLMNTCWIRMRKPVADDTPLSCKIWLDLWQLSRLLPIASTAELIDGTGYNFFAACNRRLHDSKTQKIIKARSKSTWQTSEDLYWSASTAFSVLAHTTLACRFSKIFFRIFLTHDDHPVQPWKRNQRAQQ